MLSKMLQPNRKGFIFAYTVLNLPIFAAYLYKIFKTGVKSKPRALLDLSGLVAGFVICLTQYKGAAKDYIGLAVFPIASMLSLRWTRPGYVDEKNKAVLITGCDTPLGFGQNLARRLDSLGVKVYAGCLFRDGKGAQQLAESTSSRLTTVQLDITDRGQVEAAVNYITHNLHDDQVLWCVVNNAGIVLPGELELLPMSAFEKSLQVNCLSTVRVTRACLPLIKHAQGHIVNVSSVVGKVALYNLGAYSMSKFGVEAFSDVLRQELYKWNVHVSIVEPGPYDNDAPECEEWWREHVESLWECAPPHIREQYGRQYFEAYLNTGKFSTDSNITPVIDAMEDAVLSQQPKPRYTMGQGSCILPILNTFFQPLLDRCEYLLRRNTVYTGAIPAVLKHD